jgi:hypothetical protein
MSAFQDAIERADATGRTARNNAEASLKTYQEALDKNLARITPQAGAVPEEGLEEDESGEPVVPDGAPPDVLNIDVKKAEIPDKAMRLARETLKEMPREISKESRKKVEQRLESLSKMYETKKNQPVNEETRGDSPDDAGEESETP